MSPMLLEDSLMKIRVNQVPEDGLQEHASYDPVPLDMDREDIRLREPFEVDAAIRRVDQELVVDVDISAPIELVCARCLAEFRQTLETGALFSYTVRPTDVVDITDDVRQEIVLAYPMVPLCRPDCQGLCSVCGQNLNERRCSHAN